MHAAGFTPRLLAPSEQQELLALGIPAAPVADVPGIRDFDVAHRRDALIALVPVGTSVSVPVSVILDWRSTIPAAP